MQLDKITTPTFFGSPVKDPYDLDDGIGRQTVEFHDYRRSIPIGLIRSVLQLANADALTHRENVDGLIGTERHLQYWADEVQLLLIPSEETTWRMWFGATLAMAGFAGAQFKMSYEWSFILLENGRSVPQSR